mmetsp:Transcript_90826/g.161681  ORF Transcript_90826/g.161681 Transcript_90826/m.161681 type:complete len:552 (+) Transcript_90826:52-1707(+)
MGQGQGLPKPVKSVIVKRRSSNAFRIGMAEMNGFRNSMEDAHVIYAKETWGFFGVFDGHGGDQCSKFIARRYIEEMDKDTEVLRDDAAVRDLAFRLDREFLDSKTTSGSTGTFVIVRAPKASGGKYHLRVGNIGDSRVLLGHADGKIFDGPGTDKGLTTDHKPDHPSERERIERTGGKVESVMGVSRVNGDLAVSRAFGDSQHKITGGPDPSDHPVSAEPELQEFECGSTDFIMLVCDGISEGKFPNDEVIKFAAERLRIPKDGSSSDIDLAKVAAAVCHQAVKCGSKDNLSCMIVLLGPGEVPGKEDDFLAGPAHDSCLAKNAFRKAYEAMAEHAGLTFAEVLERRYDIVKSAISKLEAKPEDPLDELGGEDTDLEGLREEMADWTKKEASPLGPVPPKDESPEGKTKRRQWFEQYLESIATDREHGNDDGHTIPADLVRLLSEQDGRLSSEPTRTIRVVGLDELKPAVTAHSALKWDDRLGNTCNKMGYVMKDDPADNTSQVRFPPPLGFKAWLPSSTLIECAEAPESDNDAAENSDSRDSSTKDDDQS